VKLVDDLAGESPGLRPTRLRV